MSKIAKEKENNSVKSEEKKTSKKISQSEFEKKVLELAKKDVTSEKIGEILRKEGIHPKNYSKKISVILKEKERACGDFRDVLSFLPDGNL